MKGERQTKAEILLDAMGFVDGDLVLQAHKAERSRREKRRRWFAGGLAACLALVLVIPAFVFLHKDSDIGNDTSSGGDSSVSLGSDSSVPFGAELQDCKIYYVEDGVLSCLSLRLEDAPQERFGAWKTANHIGEELDFLGEEAEGSYYRLTFSGSLRAYYDERKELLLLLSLHRSMADFTRYLESNAVFPDDYPAFVDIFDEQGRLLYSLRPWTDWSIEIVEYDYEQGICTISLYAAGGEWEPGVTTEPEYRFAYVEVRTIGETGTPYGPYKRTYYTDEGSVSSIYEFDGNETRRRITDYYRDGSISSIVEFDECGFETKVLHYREDGSLEEHCEIEYATHGETHQESRITYFDEGGGIEHYELYFFDENGNWAGEEYYNADNVLAFTTKCTYDERGRRLTEAVYRPDGTLEKLTEYKYGSGMFYSSYSVYYYDEEGNLASEWHGGELDGIIAGITEED